MRKQNLPLQRLMTQDSLAEVADELRYADVTALYAAVGEGHLGTQSVVEKVVEASGGDDGRRRGPRRGRRRHHAAAPPSGRRAATPASSSTAPPTSWSSSPDAARRCPATRSSASSRAATGVSVHRRDCTNVSSLQTEPERMIEVEWAPTAQSTFLVQIQVEALDRSGLLSDVTRVLSDHHVNILSASLHHQATGSP